MKLLNKAGGYSLLAVCALLCASAGWAQNPKLAFASDRSGAFEIWTADPTNFTNSLFRVTQGSSGNQVARMPSWSRVKGQIAYQFGASGVRGIHVINPDGTNGVRVTPPSTPCADDSDPAWSPDGNFIAYTCLNSGHSDIYVHDFGSGQENSLVIIPNTNQLRPAWSPDGTQVAFVSASGPHALVNVFDVSAKTIHPLTFGTALDFDPAWSPDGKQIVFSSTRIGNRHIYVESSTCPEVVQNCPAATQITTAASNDTKPAWSPDGKTLVFVSNRSGKNQLYFIDPSQQESTSNPAVLISDGLANDQEPAWPTLGCGPNGPPEVLTPSNGAVPRSVYVVLTGCGKPGDDINIFSDGSQLATGNITVESDGHWEAVVQPGRGQHQLTAQDSQGFSDPVTVNMNYVSQTRIADTTPFLYMQQADILVTASDLSPQTAYYGPNYTHVALYMGGASDGTPLIAEAVTANESGGLGQVRTVPLDVSTVYQIYPIRVAVFRPRQELTRAQRDAIVSWALSTTGRGLPYWNVPTDMGIPIGTAWLAWHVGRLDIFYAMMAFLSSNETSMSKYICSTLVWRGYLNGTQGALDLSQPNLMSAAPGSILANYTDPLFISILGQHFIVPETFVRNTQKLRQVR